VNLWQAQNMYWELLHFRGMVVPPVSEETDAYGELLTHLGGLLHFNAGTVLAAKGDI